ncbi:MAG: glycosyltransferase family 2 protein [Sphingopyxis solisilvae]|uniref:glycosyltransferase family 2 protein n=1 Tax=Sphingopyxis solisilvae TaxID=1886788 RepID=UPI0040361D06
MLIWAVWLLAIPPIFALGIFTVEALFGTLRSKPVAMSGRHPSVCILIPAHNEAAIIEATLERLRPLLSDSIRLLVVADNCSDDTALLVRQAGHTVVERNEPARRGKGYALAFGRDHLQAAPPDCVIVFDADCETDAVSIATLAEFCVGTRKIVQARYVLSADREAPAKVQISNFAFWFKNVVRQRGAARLGGAAVLTGTGMAFPWSKFENAPLASPNIVEDLALGLYFTGIGEAPVYLEQATVVSAAASEAATLAQRSRWEHGFLATARTHGFRAIFSGSTDPNQKLFQLGLHLLVPPLALLLLASIAVLLLLAVVGLLTGYWLAFAALASTVGAALILVFVNWLIEGRAWLTAGALLRIPLYLIWKLPVYLGFARGHKVDWTRTERAGDGAEAVPRD